MVNSTNYYFEINNCIILRGRIMETWLDRLLENIIMKFRIGDRANIDVKSKIGEGFSSAEVYLVELKRRF